MTNKELLDAIREIKDLKNIIQEAQNTISAYEDAIKAHMTAENLDKLSVDVFNVHWTTYESSRLDSAALKKELPEIVARYTKPSTARRFSIT